MYILNRSRLGGDKKNFLEGQKKFLVLPIQSVHIKKVVKFASTPEKNILVLVFGFSLSNEKNK